MQKGMDRMGRGSRPVFFSLFFVYFFSLDEGRVQHNTDATAHGHRREVGPEHCIHEASVSVHLADLAPGNMCSVWLAFGKPPNTLTLWLGLHNVSTLLAHVPLGLSTALDILDLDGGDVVVLGVLLPVRVVSTRRRRGVGVEYRWRKKSTGMFVVAVR